MLAWVMFQQYFPSQLRGYLGKYSQKLIGLVDPYIHITFHEFTSERLERSEAFSAIQNYLSSNSTKNAKNLKAEVARKGQSVVLVMDDYEEVTDVFNGVKVWWSSSLKATPQQSLSYYPVFEERRFFTLKFHRSHREIITEKYVEHVLKEGKEIAVRNRQRKLYTNDRNHYWEGDHVSIGWDFVIILLQLYISVLRTLGAWLYYREGSHFI